MVIDHREFVSTLIEKLRFFSELLLQLLEPFFFCSAAVFVKKINEIGYYVTQFFSISLWRMVNSALFCAAQCMTGSSLG